MSSMENEKRMRWLDMARGVALLFVMIGHCISSKSVLHHVLFTFHVPFFFVISGYLYRYKKNSFLKDMVQLAVPYMIVVACVMISTKIMGETSYYGNLRNVIKAALLGSGVKHNGILPIGAVWFFPTMYFARRYMDIVFVIAKKELHRMFMVAAFVLAGIVLASKKVWLPLNVDVAMAAVLFMYTGYLLKQKQFRLNIITAVVAFCVWLAEFSCGRFNLGTRKYGLWCVTFAGAIAASILLIELCIYMEKGKMLGILNRFLAFTGRHTVALLCIHDLDWRMPFPVWGAGIAAKMSAFPYQRLITTIRRISYDYAILLIFLLVVHVIRICVRKVRGAV
ncbi:MAG: hypothetical protein E7289_08560 [Lachnospiraceae bacterium]|nr:hypothetical protein [Lachnospiraceae bacterium]